MAHQLLFDKFPGLYDPKCNEQAPKNTKYKNFRQVHLCKCNNLCTKSYEINWKYWKHSVLSTCSLLTTKNTKNNNHKYWSKRKGKTNNLSIRM